MEIVEILTTFEILAWIIIIIISLYIIPFFAIALIFYGANMPILAFISAFLGIINMIRRFNNYLSNT